MQKILVVEDDRALNNGISLALKAESYGFMQAFDLEQARDLIKTQEVCLVILDLNLPDGNGLDFLKEIKEHMDIPVVILTARDQETEIVTGLELGADDYITKPFSLMVLRARINTQIRRVKSSGLQVYQTGDFYFSFHSMEFIKGNHPVELSKTEQRLLKLLVENRGLTLSRGELVDRIWTDGAQYVDENALSVTVKRLRDKLEDNPSFPRYIKTVYGIGYTWADERNRAAGGLHG